MIGDVTKLSDSELTTAHAAACKAETVAILEAEYQHKQVERLNAEMVRRMFETLDKFDQEKT